MSAAAEQFDPALLETLSPEEREAMQEEMTDAEKAALAAVAGDGDDDDDGDDDEAADENAAPIESADTGSDNPAAESGEPAKPAQMEVYRAELPEDFQEQVDDLKTRREELAEKFKAGDIEFDEFRAEDAALANEERKLDRAITKAEIAAEINAQKFESEWRSAVHSFTDDLAKSGGINYRADEVGQRKLDGYVKQIFSDPDNAGMSMREALEKAHSMVALVYKPASSPAPASTKPDKPAARKPDLSSLPKTLADIPGGDDKSDIGASEFSDLDGLDGFDLEMAIAKMTPSQREKYSALA